MTSTRMNFVNGYSGVHNKETSVICNKVPIFIGYMKLHLLYRSKLQLNHNVINNTIPKIA